MTSPARTTSPLSKPTLRTVSLTLAVRVTDSLARAVPSASIMSRHSTGASFAVTTVVAAGASLASGPSLPQAARIHAAATGRAAMQTRKIDNSRASFMPIAMLPDASDDGGSAARQPLGDGSGQ